MLHGVMRVSVFRQTKSHSVVLKHADTITHRPIPEVSAAIGWLVGAVTCLVCFLASETNLPSNDATKLQATIALRVTRVRTRVKDHAFSKLKPCRRQSGPSGGPYSPSEQSVPVKAPAFLGASIPLLSAGHRGSARRDHA